MVPHVYDVIKSAQVLYAIVQIVNLHMGAVRDDLNLIRVNKSMISFGHRITSTSRVIT